MKTLLIVGVSGLSVFVIAGAVYGLHRCLLSLEKRGYIYYLEKPRGGGMAGAMFEVDKLTRPSVEHVVKAQEVDVDQEKIDGE